MPPYHGVDGGVARERALGEELPAGGVLQPDRAAVAAARHLQGAGCQGEGVSGLRVEG